MSMKKSAVAGIIIGVVLIGGINLFIKYKYVWGTKVHVILPKKPSTNQDTEMIHDNLGIHNKNNF